MIGFMGPGCFWVFSLIFGIGMIWCEGHPILTQEDERPGPYFPLSFPPLPPPLFFPSLGLPPIPVGTIPICHIPGCSLRPFCQGSFGVFFPPSYAQSLRNWMMH